MSPRAIKCHKCGVYNKNFISGNPECVHCGADLFADYDQGLNLGDENDNEMGMID